MTNNAKLQELILHVAKRSVHDPAFGSIKLNKLLFFSDFHHYVATGNSITEAEYRRRQFGPCVSGLVETLNQMETRQEIFQYTHVSEGNRPARKQVLPRRAADLSKFSADEIARVEETIHLFREKSAMALSEHTHRFALWQLAEEGEEIPYFAVHVADSVPSLAKGQQRWALDAAHRIA